MKNDTWIKQQVSENNMIAPFVDHTVRKDDDRKVLSYGLSPSGYDLRLADKIIGRSDKAGLDPKNPSSAVVCEFDIEEDETGRYVWVPSGTFFASSIEYLKMPRNVSGFVLPKSTYGRCGISVINPLIDAGWEGNLTIAAVNHSKNPVKIYLGEGFCQLVLFDVGDCEVSYDERGGLYQGAKGVAMSRV